MDKKKDDLQEVTGKEFNDVNFIDESDDLNEILLSKDTDI